MSNAPVPLEQKTVLFYDDEITAVRLEDGRVMVPVRPLCNALGVDWSAQRQRINRDPVLSDVTSGVVITPTPPTSKFANPQEMMCIPLEFLNGWIFGINASRVKSEIRDRLIRYQRECYAVLYEAFQEGRLSADVPSIDDLLKSDSDAAEAYRMAHAIMKLARHQLMMEATQQQHGRRLDAHEVRLEEIEAVIGPGAAITEDQASQISQAVKAVAIALGKQTKRNEFGAVYGELYRKFGITSYKMLPADSFDEAMWFLTEWH
ncbi:MAG: ORF6C domain-containing protein [Anaerolineales bacterium]|nr:ORF6C domain-containing protein [Anaerolineales bacterium]